jgi:hypothetical protein
MKITKFILIDSGASKTRNLNAKRWFNMQIPYWGRNGAQVLNPFFYTKKTEVDISKANCERMAKNTSTINDIE